MLKKLIIVSTFIILPAHISISDKATKPPYEELVKQIKRNNSELDIKYVYEIARFIYKHAKPSQRRIVAAILKQESNYRLSAFNKRSKDYGISQVNVTNIKRLKLDKKRLLKDLEYSILCGIKILDGFSQYAGKDPTSWWTKYNSSKKSKRIKYLAAVSRYL